MFPKTLAQLHKVSQQSNRWVKRKEVKVSCKKSGKLKQWPHDSGVQTDGEQDFCMVSHDAPLNPQILILTTEDYF